MQMPNLEGIINEVLQGNPDLKQNQNAMNMVNVLMSGDARQGEELANNILRNVGVSKEQAMEMAKQRFGNRFPNMFR